MQSLDRIIDVSVPSADTDPYAVGSSARAIVAQGPVPRKGGGRIANREILDPHAVSNIIREDRFELEA